MAPGPPACGFAILLDSSYVRWVMQESNNSLELSARPGSGRAPHSRWLRPAWLFALIFWLGGLSADSTQAAGVIPLAVEMLAAKATWVVRGRVESMEVSHGHDGRMMTRVDVPVSEVWKGSPTNRIGVVLAGGILGNRRVSVTGQAEFRVGEEVVLFLIPNDRGEGVVVELAQGKFRIQQDSAGGLWVSNGVIGMAPGSAPDAGAVAATSQGNRGRVVLPFQRPLPLSELKQRVQESSKP